MKPLRFLTYFLLCAAPLAASIGPSRAADAPTATAPDAAPPTSIVRDADANRAIEIVTDYDETVPQFFARQKLVLINNANSDGKFWSVDQIVKGEAFRVFVSYPLQNDQEFRPYRYGDFYNLEKPAPGVAAFLGIQPKLNWGDTMLILALKDKNEGDDATTKARLVGRILVKNRENWRPEMEAESLKYQEPKAEIDKANEN